MQAALPDDCWDYLNLKLGAIHCTFEVLSDLEKQVVVFTPCCATGHTGPLLPNAGLSFLNTSYNAVYGSRSFAWELAFLLSLLKYSTQGKYL